MTHIQKFLDSFEIFLDTHKSKHYNECSEFLAMYIGCNLDDRQKKEMIAEYGMKRLIDLQIAYEGYSVCEELLNFDEYIDSWVHMMLMNVVSLI